MRLEVACGSPCADPPSLCLPLYSFLHPTLPFLWRRWLTTVLFSTMFTVQATLLQKEDSCVNNSNSFSLLQGPGHLFHSLFRPQLHSSFHFHPACGLVLSCAGSAYSACFSASRGVSLGPMYVVMFTLSPATILPSTFPLHRHFFVLPRHADHRIIPARCLLRQHPKYPKDQDQSLPGARRTAHRSCCRSRIDSLGRPMDPANAAFYVTVDVHVVM
jgi:hypothetical protein